MCVFQRKREGGWWGEGRQDAFACASGLEEVLQLCLQQRSMGLSGVISVIDEPSHTGKGEERNSRGLEGKDCSTGHSHSKAKQTRVNTVNYALWLGTDSSRSAPSAQDKVQIHSHSSL